MGQAKSFTFVPLLIACAALLDSRSRSDAAPPQDATIAALEGTAPLDWQGDLAARMVDGIDRFLLRKTEESVANRARHWNRDFSSHEAYTRAVEPNRERLAHILGVRDDLERGDGFHTTVDNSGEPIFRIRAADLTFLPVKWPAFGSVHGEGLLMYGPDPHKADIIIIPDAGQAPEELAGLTGNLPSERQLARRFAESGCRVYVVALVDRTLAPRNERAKLTSREFLHRPAYELGRTLAGYEIQIVQSLLDQIDGTGVDAREAAPHGIVGWGEGGLIALYAAALDTRLDAALVSGAFDDRLGAWTEPIERNAFGLLDQFGGAEIASLVAPRALVIEASAWPAVEVAPGNGGAPGSLKTPPLTSVQGEVDRARHLIKALNPQPTLELVLSGDDGDGPSASDTALSAFLRALHNEITLAGPKNAEQAATQDHTAWNTRRQSRLLHQLDRHTQGLLAESPYTRAEFMKNLDTSTPEKFAATVEPYREIFYRDVIGRFDDPLLPANPRSRKIYETEKLTGYEVVLDVWPDVFAYGILTLPKDLKDGEKRPVVVCQHGLEGRPRDAADPNVDSPYYNQYALRLAERGFITFSPQNPYIGGDRFRTLQRKANPLGKTLFSIIVPQHQQITDWLKTLPYVDPARIAFYGLSYGGKSAMRIPPLVKNYCLSICSADFNDWVWKNASTRSPYSYVWTGEYEIFEWDLGSTFNYAEMAALIAPRPFMVERGHFDGVAPDETVAYEFAKVRHLYNAKLKLPPDRCQIEWFVGPHTIHGVGTFQFLHHHLNWPIREDQPIVPLNKP